LDVVIGMREVRQPACGILREGCVRQNEYGAASEKTASFQVHGVPISMPNCFWICSSGTPFVSGTYLIMMKQRRFQGTYRIAGQFYTCHSIPEPKFAGPLDAWVCQDDN
jgi:hypothetical protein